MSEQCVEWEREPWWIKPVARVFYEYKSLHLWKSFWKRNGNNSNNNMLLVTYHQVFGTDRLRLCWPSWSAHQAKTISLFRASAVIFFEGDKNSTKKANQNVDPARQVRSTHTRNILLVYIMHRLIVMKKKKKKSFLFFFWSTLIDNSDAHDIIL